MERPPISLGDLDDEEAEVKYQSGTSPVLEMLRARSGRESAPVDEAEARERVRLASNPAKYVDELLASLGLGGLLDSKEEDEGEVDPEFKEGVRLLKEKGLLDALLEDSDEEEEENLAGEKRKREEDEGLTPAQRLFLLRNDPKFFGEK